jgi:hypothetical protein
MLEDIRANRADSSLRQDHMTLDPSFAPDGSASLFSNKGAIRRDIALRRRSRQNFEA